MEQIKNYILLFFTILFITSCYFAFQVKFVYEFEQFFPKGDPELDFFYEFREKFEPDDNFLLVGLKPAEGVYKKSFLTQLDSLTRSTQKLPGIKSALSLTNAQNFIKSPFGFLPYPIVHINNSDRYYSDSLKITKDERLIGNLISKDGSTVVISLKTEDSLDQKQSELLVDSLNLLLTKLKIKDPHILGKANFQTVLVRQQINEFILSTLISAVLVLIVFILIFRKLYVVAVALVSILMCLTIFVGAIGASGVSLDVMSALFPILMMIVGISDVVHFTTKYINELKKGQSKNDAMAVTAKEIGMAIFLTSFTTAIGFLTLMTSKIMPVKKFGIMAAIGVVMAYLIVFVFTTTLLSKFSIDKIISEKRNKYNWNNLLDRVNHFTKDHPKRIAFGTLLFLMFTFYGISLISIDVKISDTLPRGFQITKDFDFFNDNFSGFRPFEIAASVKNDSVKIDDYHVLMEVNKVESFIKTIPEISGIQSITTLYKSINRAYNGDRPEEYQLPESKKEFDIQRKMADKLSGSTTNILISKDKKYGRISSRILDIGTDSIRTIMSRIDSFIVASTDTSLIQFKQTGTGVIIDKNNEYLRDSLIGGLAIAFIAISIIMALLFRSWKMVIISLIPNIFPLLLSGAMIGYLSIQLDAPTAIIFAISFGIAVDDTIHFLSKLKLELAQGTDVDIALQNTFRETGKAIIITTIILFFGFLILLVSANPATFRVGFLLSITLFSAVIADLLLIPVMVRKWLKN